ncbi:hypothetical protein Y11_03221 [Yersinia enterocolitica subsp. palearctica Y11]|uniref:Uncharacterized protein n=2 Tax=Yersinia enterocolitica TaxID=630 RepID=A0A0H3NTE5_YERE1|nr:hypothetical protein IOK_10398 [Yersinia enterocolitica subsp. palearctica PhRBD_Ye1]CBX70000.1 unknown protein [Yersinia enterocolitica W22703]CBY27859.1 hypothetical protein Y11_03221 [Yersinia enterocolitica subsp. palearctica Y11]
MAVSTFSADTFGVLEVDATLIFSQWLLHGVAGDAERGITGFMEDSGSSSQERGTDNNADQQNP